MNRICFLLFLILFCCCGSECLAQQLERLTAEDPYQLQSFTPEHVRTHKIKSVFIQEAIKSPGKTISYKRTNTRLFFNTDGTLRKSIKVINRSTGFLDSTTTLFFYLNGKLEREELFSKAGNQITYNLYPKNGLTEHKLLKQDQSGGRYILDKSTTFETIQTSDLERTIVETSNYDLISKEKQLFDAEQRLVQSERTQESDRRKTITKWNYEFGKLVDMKVVSGKTEDLYEISYGKNSIIKKIQHSKNGTMAEAVEYFYFNGNIESVLRIEPNSNELEITNYSYEFY